MNFLLKIIFVLILSLSITDFSIAQKKKPVATIFKPVGGVEYKTGEKEWSKAKAATPLIPGDIVRTQENSFAIIKFLENSVIRVQEKSEVTISGEIAKGEFSKNVYLQRGEVGFQVKKRANEKFEFSTPTSVASIRGTGGLLIAGQDSNDVLILGSGNVDFKNLISNIILNVRGGQTAFSMPDGTVKVEDSTPEEKRLLNQGSADSTKSEGNNQGGSKSDTSTSTSTSGITLGLTVNAPIGKEGQNLVITVEVNQSSVTTDSLKNSVSDFTLYYRTKADQPYKMLKEKLSERTAKFSIPGSDVSAPSIQVYAVITLLDGSQFSSPTPSPESNPISFAVQTGQKNELRVPFTDPSGKRKTMIIEYK
ncbi:MAG: FecR family protein [Bacteroidota bacterium]|nr:FecR family protein [Bacteroidota bacterium]